MDFVAPFFYGLFPACIWLIFWLFQDRKNPEPKRLIAWAFLVGMISIPFVIDIQMLISSLQGETLKVILWAFTEEAMKLLFAALFVLPLRHVDEPLDMLIYMIVVALGFSALENTLYVRDPLRDAEFAQALNTTGLRFIGASLVHIISSASIGVALAFSFYSPLWKKILAACLGLVIATGLHAVFNLLIISLSQSAIFVIFVTVWMLILVLILIAERIKKLEKYRTLEY